MIRSAARNPGKLQTVAVCALAVLAGTGRATAQTCDGISPALEGPLTVVEVASPFNRPTFVTAPPGDTERFFVLEQDGAVRIVRNGVIDPTPFLDVAALTFSPVDGGGSEEGLLGMAFHPDYESNGRFFVFHTTNDTLADVLVRYERSTVDPDLADPASRQVVLTIPHEDFRNHRGGMLQFGPLDGHLYIGTGDGGASCDPNGYAQDLSSLLGKLLRIDVSSLPYSVPPDNAFVGVAGAREEIWAYGLRNLWRFSLDALNGDLFLGDVGQWEWEEVSYLAGGGPGGGNFGWDLYEGSYCPNPSCGSPTCDLPGHIPPVVEYNHDTGGCAVAGGYVYRGCRMPWLRGTYFYGDYCNGFVGSFRMVAGLVKDWRDRTAELQPAGGVFRESVNSFGLDGRGEILLLDFGGTGPRSEAYKIVPVLSSLEVSGTGATPFLPAAGGDWLWEDLTATSSHPITQYRVYRADAGPGGPFDCVFGGPAPSWPGGDPDVPFPGEGFFYLTTARNAQAVETYAGAGSDGTTRNLSAVPCPG